MELTGRSVLVRFGIAGWHGEIRDHGLCTVLFREFLRNFFRNGTKCRVVEICSHDIVAFVPRFSSVGGSTRQAIASRERATAGRCRRVR